MGSKCDKMMSLYDMKKVTPIMSAHITCPNCKSRKQYKLSDGRRKCVSCKKRFSVSREKWKLTKKQIIEIVRLFWLLVPAERVAEDLRINRKSVQRYYHKIRQKIAEEGDRVRPVLSGEIEVDESYFGGVQKGKRGRGAAGKVPVFGLLKRKGQVVVVIPDRVSKAILQGFIKEYVEPDSIVFSDSFRAYENLDVEGFRHQRIDHGVKFSNGKSHINGIENFWGFAKQRLKIYHGGYKKNFYLFLKEMEFRFNNRNNKTVLKYLLHLLESGPV